MLSLSSFTARTHTPIHTRKQDSSCAPSIFALTNLVVFFFLNETESRVLVCMVLSFPFYSPCYSGVFSFLELTYVCTVKYTNAGTNTTIAIHIFLRTKHTNISFLETS